MRICTVKFTHSHQLCIQNKDFVVEGEQFTFTQKSTTLDYILFDKHVLNGLKRYKIIEEGAFSITSDHLPVVAYFDLKIQRHSLMNSNTILPAWHKATPESIVTYRNQVERNIHKLLLSEIRVDKDIYKFVSDITEILITFDQNTIPFLHKTPTRDQN